RAVLFRSTNQITAIPNMALSTPINRSAWSGASNTAATARRVCAGKAAKTRPSITKTSPSATANSDIVCYRTGPAQRSLLVAVAGAFIGLAVRIIEIAEEIRVGLDHQS